MRVLLYHQKDILSMLWNAAQDYPGRKRMQRKSVQGEKTKDCIKALQAAWLNIIFSILSGAKASQLAHTNSKPIRHIRRQPQTQLILPASAIHTLVESPAVYLSLNVLWISRSVKVIQYTLILFNLLIKIQSQDKTQDSPIPIEFYPATNPP